MKENKFFLLDGRVVKDIIPLDPNKETPMTEFSAICSPVDTKNTVIMCDVRSLVPIKDTELLRILFEEE